MDKAEAVEQWGVDGFVFTEAVRGGALPWRVGDAKLRGDVLGPVRHAHDDAGEYYYMFSGSAHVETGGVEFVLEEGQLGYIPPDAPHNFTGPASDADACLFCVIAPNLVEKKWRVKDFLPGSEELRMAVGTPFEDEALPGGGMLAAHAVALDAGSEPVELVPESCEMFHLVVEGELSVSLENGLHGKIETGRYLHVREGVRHVLSADAPCRVLRMDCFFEAWKGVPLGADAA
jgi:mannose-6-phosphate isomerase-like protein (cupin superfamily)